jgi:hypothetical protein
MKNRTLMICLIVALTASVFTALSVFSQEDVQNVRDSAFGARMRPPVVFNHEEHNAKAGLEDCAICHHSGFDEDGVAIDGDPEMECSECHMAGGADEMELVRIYHLNCKGCHEAEKAGPVQCAECHNKDNVYVRRQR